MSENEKIYVIDLGEELEMSAPSPEPRSTARASVKPQLANPMPVPSLHTNIKATRAPKKLGPVQVALFVGLAYLLGPFALLMTHKGRENSKWLAAGLISGVAGIALLLWGPSVKTQLGGGWSLLLLAVAVSLVVLTWFTTWSRAVYFAGTLCRRNAHQLPEWIDRPWSVGSMGFMIPGMGLLVAGCPRKAASVIMAAGPIFLAGLLLLNANWIWDLHMTTGWNPISSSGLESIFMLAGVTIFVALLGWATQALEGIRQVNRHKQGNRNRGDWYAVALLATAATMVVVANPTQMASQLDRQGELLREDGYQVIPLYMTLTANRLDPSQSQYAVKAMDLYSELGQTEAAAKLRNKLDQSLDTYVQLVMNEQPHAPETVIAKNQISTRAVAKPEPDPVDENFVGPIYYGTMASSDRAAETNDPSQGQE